MHRIDGPGATVDNKFTDGDPVAGVQATVVTDDWLNDLQENIISVLAGAGVMPVKGRSSDLLDAIKKFSGGIARIRLLSNLTIYVAPSGIDAAGRGLSAETPFLTGTYAYNFVQRNYDLNGFNVTIQLANGAYGQIICSGQCIGAQGAAVTIRGNTDALNVTIAAAANGQGLISANGGALIQVTGVTLWGGAFTGCIGLLTSLTSTIIFSNVVFGVMAGGSHIQSSGQIQSQGAYVITGGAAQHMAATSGTITILSAVTLTGTSVFSNAFAYSLGCGSINSESSGGASFTGAATGARYSAIRNGVINTAGGGASFFPGSVAGSVSTGGQYA